MNGHYPDEPEWKRSCAELSTKERVMQHNTRTHRHTHKQLCHTPGITDILKLAGQNRAWTRSLCTCASPFTIYLPSLLEPHLRLVCVGFTLLAIFSLSHNAAYNLLVTHGVHSLELPVSLHLHGKLLVTRRPCKVWVVPISAHHESTSLVISIVASAKEIGPRSGGCKLISTKLYISDGLWL